LTTDIIRLASHYGRYGYRRITAMLRSEGWTVNAKRVERIWRREGLKVPQKQPKRGRLWLNDGSPTPMKISGGELIMDGECGGAYVRILDARKGFAHWLRTSGHGDRDHRAGILFYAETNTQSADRAMAYAEAFAQVLRRNGVQRHQIFNLTLVRE
jgi:hypothetical protein